ncbi:7,8-dihydroneopterin aldolase [Thermaurantimonas aggregans]|uniref:7,8-dihydroneopterin aldolase n=1 Tax=Thermaurantimonas aggregans TaxID=2173829 RepID=A0A401XMQ5_9FLAO|nr:dihydroneopterin aldolase [Thermaurantimonas aggregans]MCX8149405.1 dihydroneopterin aldolase [Thermaurantimonas aggregans]GCD78300.1 7,8-dihydroneopterin aldolase [Thermaurantimonas aggregans]
MRFKIKLENIRIYGFNGCIEEESKIGTEYIVNIEITTVNTSYKIDELTETVDYCQVYAIIEEESRNRYNLIETLAHKIFHRIKSIPNIEGCIVEIKKLNPPINGDVESVTVIFAT